MLYLVSKYPRVGVSKSRLGAAIGAERACVFAEACLEDLLFRFSEEDHKEVLFWPESDQELFAAWIGRKQVQGWGLHGVNTEVFQGLGAILQHGFDEAPANDVVVFIGMDTPHLTTQDMRDAIAYCKGNSKGAYIIPSMDGGYVLLALWKSGPQDDAFRDVIWSTGATFATQVRALLNAGFQVKIGPNVYVDVDEVADLQHLKDHETDLDIPPNVKAFLDNEN